MLNSGVTDFLRSLTFEKEDIFKVIGDVTDFVSSSSFQVTFIESESFPTGMETFNASARFAKLCTPLNKSPRS